MRNNAIEYYFSLQYLDQSLTGRILRPVTSLYLKVTICDLKIIHPSQILLFLSAYLLVLFCSLTQLKLDRLH